MRYKIKVSNNTAAVSFRYIQADPEDITSSVDGSLQLGTSVRLDEFVTAVCVDDLFSAQCWPCNKTLVGFDTFDTNGEVSPRMKRRRVTKDRWARNHLCGVGYDASAKAQCVRRRRCRQGCWFVLASAEIADGCVYDHFEWSSTIYLARLPLRLWRWTLLHG